MAQAEGIAVNLGHITHNTRSESGEALNCVCLVLERGARRLFLPEQDFEIHAGDRLLFAGRSSAHREMLRALIDPVLLMDFATPHSMPRSAVWRWLGK